MKAFFLENYKINHSDKFNPFVSLVIAFVPLAILGFICFFADSLFSIIGVSVDLSSLKIVFYIAAGLFGIWFLFALLHTFVYVVKVDGNEIIYRNMFFVKKKYDFNDVKEVEVNKHNIIVKFEKDNLKINDKTNKQYYTFVNQCLSLDAKIIDNRK